MVEAKPEFFSVFMPRINALRMRVCDDFLATLSEDLIPERVVLRNSLGKGFSVEVSEENGGVYFDWGWPDFVAENGLEVGFVLVFRCDGQDGFDVKIFDHSGCEKYIGEGDIEEDEGIKAEDCGGDEADDGDEEEDEPDSDDTAADFSDNAFKYSGASGPRISTNTKKNVKIR